MLLLDHRTPANKKTFDPDGVADGQNAEGDSGDLDAGSNPHPLRRPIIGQQGGEEEDEEEHPDHHAQIKLAPKWMTSESAEDARQIAAQRRHRHADEVQAQPTRRHLEGHVREA